ncbi:MAG: pentapeptide repeat-containing protein [Tissierellia bacterium]|nr:pentapeptide repeat-containing protein [Tissierellia bacterium]
MDLKDLKDVLNSRVKLNRLDLKNESFTGLDLSGYDLRNIDFSWANFVDCSFDGADFSYSTLEDSYFPNTSCRSTNFFKTNLKGANMRFVDLTGADIRGAYLYSANLEDAILENLIYDDSTQYYKLKCPEKGAFIGYKTCFNDRLVTLLILEDAIRTSATMDSCRTNKAKVVSITSFDGKKHFEEAQSYVDENFIYRTGEIVEVLDFNPDRWRDSTTGIHFWMTREEACSYMSTDK